MGSILITSSLGGSLALAAPRELTIQAGAGSTVDFAGVTTLAGGSLNVSAGSIQVDGTLTSQGGSISAFDASPGSDFTVDPATLAAVTGNVVLPGQQ